MVAVFVGRKAVIAELRTPAHFAVHGRGRALRVTTTCFCGIEAERRRRLPRGACRLFRLSAHEEAWGASWCRMSSNHHNRSNHMNVRHLVPSVSRRLLSMGSLILAASLHSASGQDFSKYKR